MKAYGYLRVSGKAQIEGDGFTRQETALRAYAQSHGLEVAAVYKDGGVSGTAEGAARPGWLRMLSSVISNGVRCILIEKLDRIARDLMVQEHILKDLKDRGIQLISAAEPDLCSDDPTRKLLRQIMGAIAEYDKAMVVLKLRGARERAKLRNGRCEGRKPYGWREEERPVVEQMRSWWGEGVTAAEIARRLGPRESGRLWHPHSVARIVGRPMAHSATGQAPPDPGQVANV